MPGELCEEEVMRNGAHIPKTGRWFQPCGCVHRWKGMNRMLVFTLAVAVGGSASGQDQIIITPPGEDPFLTPPGNAVAWQVRNDDPAHIDGPFAIPGRLNHLGRPVVMDPMLPLTATPFGSAFWGTGVGCVLFHLHTDPAPPNPPTAPPYALFDDGSGLAAGFHPDPDRGSCGHWLLSWHLLGVCGDQNADGIVNRADALLDLQLVAGLTAATPVQMLLSDVDRDGALTANDAKLILQHDAGLFTIPTSGCGPPANPLPKSPAPITLTLTEAGTGLSSVQASPGQKVTWTVKACGADILQAFQFQIGHDNSLVDVPPGGVVPGTLPPGYCEPPGMPGQNFCGTETNVDNPAGTVRFVSAGIGGLGMTCYNIGNIMYTVVGSPGNTAALTFGNPGFWDDSSGVMPVTPVGGEIMITLSTPCPWDLDGDGNVGTSDLLELLAGWGLPGNADFDGDNNVGTIDLLAMLANWAPCPIAAAPSEPAAPGPAELDATVVVDVTDAAAAAAGGRITHLYATGSVAIGIRLLGVGFGNINADNSTFHQDPAGGDTPPSAPLNDTYVTFNRLTDFDDTSAGAPDFSMSTTNITGTWYSIPDNDQGLTVDISGVTGNPGQVGVLIAQIVLPDCPGTGDPAGYSGTVTMFTKGGNPLGVQAAVDFVLGPTGDFNCDGVVDLTDYDELWDCLTEFGTEPFEPDSGCGAFDLDPPGSPDGDLDLLDWHWFQILFGKDR